jgi:DNA-binding NtrC family response regulator
MLRVFELIEIYAPSDEPALICGESGTGKELVARALHDRSSRRHGPFVAMNCVGFPETMLEDELFGHERGAFTDAIRRREGRFRAADHGILFLDEVGEMPLPAQAKLLRVIESGEFEPIGTNQTARVDVRIVSATNRDLGELVAAGRFREDLYYRLKVLDMVLPPLRSRPEDLRPLVEHFLRVIVPEGPLPSISERAWTVLYAYPFHGNVRELEHVIKRAVVLSRRGPIDVEHLSPEVAAAGTRRPETPESIQPLAQALHAFERQHIALALRATGGHRHRAARILGISRKTLWEKMRTYGIRPGELR